MPKKNIVLKYFIFDFDDNILHMDTKIIMERNIDNCWTRISLSTSEFSDVRKNPDYRIPLKEDGSHDYDLAYSNFRDDVSDTAFLNDVIDAITNKKFAPSYWSFKKCLVEGKLFAVITARGHEPYTIKRAIQYFIETQLNEEEKKMMKYNLIQFYKMFDSVKTEDSNILLDKYLSTCEFIGVSSDYFKEYITSNNLLEKEEEYNLGQTEFLKKVAVNSFAKKCISHGDKLKGNKVKIKIGFSDDDKHNVNSIKRLFSEKLKKQFPEVSFVIYDTSKNDDGSSKYKKEIV